MALSPADFSLALKSDFMATDSQDRVKRAGVWILTTSFIYWGASLSQWATLWHIKRALYSARFLTGSQCRTNNCSVAESNRLALVMALAHAFWMDWIEAIR